MSEPFIAEIKIFASNFAPRGWAFCNGQVLPIAQNSALFSLVGTTYGGDGQTTFALPNLQGRAAMHPGTGPGLSPRRLGESGGAAAVNLSAAEIPTHNHPMNGAPSADQASPDASHGLGNAPMYATPGPTLAMGANAIGSTGGSLPHNNLQPYLAINYVIALQGIYPPRS